MTTFFGFSNSRAFNSMPYLSFSYFCFLNKYLKIKIVSNSNAVTIFYASFIYLVG